MNRELVEYRRNAGREASTVDHVKLPRCALFHFTLSPFAEWKPSTSHPSNPRLHASASNFIHHNYAACCPLSPRLFASRSRTFPFFEIDVHRLYSHRERSSIDRALLIRATCDSVFSQRKINALDLRSMKYLLSHKNNHIIATKQKQTDYK